MKRKKNKVAELDKIEFSQYILTKKKKILFSCLVGLIVGYIFSLVYSNNLIMNKKDNKTNVALQGPPEKTFASYNSLLFGDDYLNIVYANTFHTNILHMYKYPDFEKKFQNNYSELVINNKIDMSNIREKIFILSKNKKIFFDPIKIKSQIYKYEIVYPIELLDNEFVLFYINHVKVETLKQVKEIIDITFMDKIEQLNLTNTDNIILEYIISSDDTKTKPFIEYSQKFAENKQSRINYYSKKYEEFKNDQLDFNPVLFIEKTKDLKFKSKSLKYSVNGFLLGLFFSIFYFFLVYLILNQNKKNIIIK